MSMDPASIPDDTRIVRYMKWSAFFMLLCGRVFLPSLRTLQAVDTHEGRLPSHLFDKYYGHHLRTILEPHEDWLRIRAEVPEVPKESGHSSNYAYFQFLADIWLAELEKRRCVWCWNRYEHESYALWQLYGPRGVAVHTTLGRVKQALEKAGPLRGLVVAVDYAIPRRAFFTGEDTKPIESMMRQGFVEKPYLYKRIGYKFEQEIRFVFGINPNLFTAKPASRGAIIELDFLKLMDFSSLWATRIELSPDIPKTEESAVGTLIQSLDWVKMHDLLEIEKGYEQKAEASGSPFTMSDEPVGLFPDLG
jgi:hypothetical protein